MRKVLLAIVAVVQLTIVGCHHNTRHAGVHACRHCGNGHGGAYGSGGPSRVPYLHAIPPVEGGAGPQTASYSYPYYTLRAPRDFLLNNPPSIGP